MYVCSVDFALCRVCCPIYGVSNNISTTILYIIPIKASRRMYVSGAII